MQPHERVVLKPAPAHPVTPVHERDPHLRRVVDEGVGEPHPHHARADHQVIDLDPVRNAPTPSSTTSARPVCEVSRTAPEEPPDTTVLGGGRAEITTLGPVPVTARMLAKAKGRS